MGGCGYSVRDDRQNIENIIRPSEAPEAVDPASRNQVIVPVGCRLRRLVRSRRKRRAKAGMFVPRGRELRDGKEALMSYDVYLPIQIDLNVVLMVAAAIVLVGSIAVLVAKRNGKKR